MWLQREIALQARPRGFHLVTREVLDALPELAECRIGLLHLLLKHTSASLTINENADPNVRGDFERYFTRAVPENEPWYEHDDEGPDDLPAHIKSSILGAELTLPVTNGQFSLGTWQGLYLGEHRDRGGSRRVLATLWGEAGHGKG